MAAVTVICEIGSSPAPAWLLDFWCQAAFRTGSNAVKIQLWKPEHFGAAEVEEKRPYAFPRNRLQNFVLFAHARGLSAGASVFDDEAVALAAQHCDFLKLAWRERGNDELTWAAVYAARDRDLPVYRTIDHPDADSLFVDAVQLFTVPEYPAGLVRSYARLLHRALWMRRNWPGLPWGWSSHSVSGSECVLACRLGAQVLERHLALSPDDIEAGHSSSPGEFAKLVKSIRSVNRKDIPHVAA